MAVARIGEFLSVLRKAQGMTQRELAEHLHVSDKAVSRWERGETAPDLTLLPVIAELFGVTVDELLRGERKTKADSLKEPAKLPERQLQILLKRGMHRFCSVSLISLALVFIGLLVLVICAFGLDQPIIGLGLTGCFMVASFICECVFLVHALSSVVDETLTGDLVDRYKHTIMKWFSVVVYANVLLFFCALPICAEYLFGVVLNGNRFFGSFGRWLESLPLACVLAGMVWILLSLALYLISAKKLHFGEAYVKAQRANTRKRLVVLGAVLATSVIAIMGQRIWVAEANRVYETAGEKFLTFEEFKQYAETPTDIEIYDEMTGEWRNYREYDGILWQMRTLYDRQGNEYTYMERNQNIRGVRFDEETMTSFVVYTIADQYHYNAAIHDARTAAILLMLAGLVTSVAVYAYKRTRYPWEKKREKRAKGERVVK